VHVAAHNCLHSAHKVRLVARRGLTLECPPVQMFCAEVVVGVLLAKYYGNSANASDKLPHHIAILVIVFICIFIASFAWSWGPLGWLVPS